MTQNLETKDPLVERKQVVCIRFLKLTYHLIISFDFESLSGTRECSKDGSKIFDESLVIVDTPGLNDRNRSNESICHEVVEFLKYSGGVNAFFCVMKVDDRSVHSKDKKYPCDGVIQSDSHKHITRQ